MRTTPSPKRRGSSPPTSALKKLSLTELMDLQVTSVSKHTGKIVGNGFSHPGHHSGGYSSVRRNKPPEALRWASNLKWPKSTPAMGISALGLTRRRQPITRVMDGRSLYTPRLRSVLGCSRHPHEDIDRIEVISGPEPRLGANAVNGVITYHQECERHPR